MQSEDVQIIAYLNAAGFSPLPQDASLFIAWSSIDRLLLAPEGAALSLPETRFIQLPVSARELFARCAEARGKPSRSYVQLTRPVGQLKWAVAELAKSMARDDKSSEERLRELRRFCGENWYGWFDCVLEGIDFGKAFEQETTRRLAVVAEAVEGVSVQSAVSSLLRLLIGDGNVARAIVEDFAVTRYALTSPSSKGDMTVWLKHLKEQVWLLPILSEADCAVDKLDASGISDENHIEAIDRITSIKSLAMAAGAALERILAGGGEPKALLAQAHEDLGKLLDTARTFAREENRLKACLMAASTKGMQHARL